MGKGAGFAHLKFAASAAAFAAAFVAFTLSASRADDESVSASPATAPLQSVRTVDMRLAPRERFDALKRPPAFMPLLVGSGPAAWLARKTAARSNRGAPRDLRPWPAFADRSSRTPPALAKFPGMADSASICPYFGGCQPPDQALAASSAWVLQGVNTSFALYDSSGVLQSGWPKTAQSFFNVPNPGTCDPNGPFLSDPRAFYDPADGHFWVAALQVEGAFGLNACREVSLYWVALSQTGDPNGAWNVYSFDMRLGTTNAADFTQIGLDGRAFYFGGNMFDKGGAAFAYDEIFAVSKKAMEAGKTVTARGLSNIKIGATFVDTLQPVLVEGVSPAAGLFVASQNINSGGGNCSTGCSGINVFAMASPLTAPKLSHKGASSMTYALAPLADQKNCVACIETFDTRISAAPVYSGGLISFALETAVSNGSAIVPGVMWGQIHPTLHHNKITGASMVQNAVLSFGGDQAASFGAMMPDASNNLIVVFDTMSAALNPSIEYAGRLSADPPSTLQAPVLLKHGEQATVDSRWGDYCAASFDPATQTIWIAAEYSGLGTDWSTFIASTHF